MAKKKADPQQSKKSMQKKKQQAIEDKTFGLKNKNKSKKVQQKVSSIEKNILNSGDPRQRKLEEQRAKEKADRKARQKAAKEEQDALFGAALMAVQKKGAINKKDGKVEAQGRDGNEDSKKTTSRAMKMMFQMDAKEMSDKLKEDPNYVPTLEDEIEDQRQKKVAELKKAGKGTPITPETFEAWKERKRKLKAEENRKRVEAEMKKKKGGKGLSVLTGRALYEYKQDLFKEREDDAEDGGGGAATETTTTTTTATVQSANGNATEDTKPPATKATAESASGTDAAQVAASGNLQSDLFLQGDDDDLDDLDDD